MLLPDQSGIICDFCGMTYKDEFKYYSTSASKYQVTSKNKILMKSPPRDAKFDHDMCEACYGELLERVKANLKPAKKNAIKCDLSTTFKSSNFEYYLILFDLVSVDKDASEKVTVERNVMDLNVIVGFDELLKKIEVIKKKIKNQDVWT